MLKKSRGKKWRVNGGATNTAFFFTDATEKERAEYLDPSKYRFIQCGDEVRVGAIVTLSDDGKRVIWP